MAFLTETEPPRHVALPVIPGVRRIVAQNPGPMTLHGTNTYLIDDAEGIAVMDPGPGDPVHLADILRVTQGRVTKILLTHGHPDHATGAPALAAATGAPIYSHAPSVMEGLVPDVVLQEGDSVLGMRVLHTPGHSADHLCFARPDGIVFSGDHVMAWSTTFVALPTGNMSDFLEQLRRLIARKDRLYLPAHGPVLPDPTDHMQQALNGRLKREAEILRALQHAASPLPELARAIYPTLTHPRLIRAAERTLGAHLEKLARDGLAIQAEGHWRAMPSATAPARWRD